MWYKRNKSKGVWWKEWLRSLLLAMLFLLIFRNFFFTLYMVRSDSMNTSVEPGDWITVNLLAYGPRIPSTPVCVPFTPWYLKSAELPVMRIPGYRTPKRNDVMVFNYPGDTDDAIERKEVYIKRLIGLPGDTVAVFEDKVYIDSRVHREVKTVWYDWIVKTKAPKELAKWIKSKGKKTHELVPGEWLVRLSEAEKNVLQKKKFVTEIVFPEYLDDAMLETLFTGKLKGYDILHFAKTCVPYEGLKIKLTPLNIQLYGHCIINEGFSLQFDEKKCLIDNEVATEYVFNEDHYFVLGDSRSSSVDSRYWGFVPHSHILGRASFVFFSFGNNQNNGGINWSRCLKNIY
ncbi:MAG: signal peptidase I [Flavobacteriales bacterium]